MHRLAAAAFAALITFPALAAELPTLPHPNITPGSLNPAVTQENIASTICDHGWTKTIRPPASFTNRLKRQQMVQYGYPSEMDPRQLEEDHRVPLELGGHPTDPANLWPESWNGPRGAHAKDRIETAVKRDVCAGRLTLRQGQAIFLGDWWEEGERRYPASGRHRK